MTHEETISREEKQLLSVELAYPLAIASYDTLIKRIDALDGRIQSLMVFMLGLCLAVPTIAKAQTLSLNSAWFITASIFMLVAIIISVCARHIGTVKVITPTHLWKGWLHLSPFEFRKNAIYDAKEAYTANKAVLDRKWNLSIASMASFGLALMCLILWVSIPGLQI